MCQRRFSRGNLASRGRSPARSEQTWPWATRKKLSSWSPTNEAQKNPDLSQIPQSQFQSSLSCRPLYSYQRYHSPKEGRTRFFARGSLPCVAPSSLPRLLPPFLAWPWLVLCLVLASCLAHPSPRPCLFLCPVPCLVLLARFPLSRLLSISANDLSP